MSVVYGRGMMAAEGKKDEGAQPVLLDIKSTDNIGVECVDVHMTVK